MSRRALIATVAGVVGAAAAVWAFLEGNPVGGVVAIVVTFLLAVLPFYEKGRSPTQVPGDA